jgi:hypothetical protein
MTWRGVGLDFDYFPKALQLDILSEEEPHTLAVELIPT